MTTPTPALTPAATPMPTPCEVALDLVRQVSTHLNGAEPVEVRLSRAAEPIRATLGAVFVVIRDRDPLAPLLRLRGIAGADGAHQLIRIGKSGPGLAVAEQRTIRIDIDGETGQLPGDLLWASALGVTSWVGTPLVTSGRCCGMLSAGFRKAPGQTAVDLMESLAPVMALALSAAEAAETAGVFRAIADASPELITTFDPDGQIFYMNTTARARLGIGAGDPAGSIFDYRRPEWPAFVRESVIPALRAGGEWRGDTEHVTLGGDAFRTAQTSIAHRDASGAVRLVSNLSREIGETENRLRLAEERTRFALEAARAGIWEYDLRTGSVIWSDTMRTVQGIGTEEACGTFDSFLTLIHPRDRAMVTSSIQAAVADAASFQMKFRILWPDGSVHWVESHGQVISDPVTGEPARTLGFAQDITEREQLEEQLRKAQRIEAVGQLAGGLAHDFNNLLTVILGFAGLLNESFDDADARRQEVEEIRRAGLRAAELTRQLLAFSRQQVMQPRVIDLNHLIDDSTRMLQRLAGEHISLAVHAAANLPAIKADKGQLEQVLVNLVVNARDAMPHGGALTIRTSAVTEDGGAAPARVRLDVIDTGIGMDDAVKRRIFEPFFTTKAVGQGTGLGLATVFGIVGQSGGTIDVESAPGKGTTFTIELPAVFETELAAVERRDSFPRGGETILVVEDDAAVRSLVSIALGRCGYQMLVAPGPAEALALSAAHDGAITLLLSDVIMPGMSGAELYRELIKNRPDLSVAYMSGFAHQAIEHHGVLRPGVTFLQKPFTATELARRVRTHLDELPRAAATR